MLKAIKERGATLATLGNLAADLDEQHAEGTLLDAIGDLAPLICPAHLELALSPVPSERRLNPSTYAVILKELQYLRPT